MTSRHLDWPGCYNVRDLGGLPAAGGRVTAHRAVVRADAVDLLTAEGWSALVAYGIRTVIDLRNEDERRSDVAVRPSIVRTIELPLDNVSDRAFWDEWDTGPQFGTPLYYLPHLKRFPDRSARVLAAIATAGPGGVLFHCQGGRDRSGQIAMLLLALAGVSPDAIADDYELSHERLRVAYAARGEPDQGPALVAHLSELGTSARAVIGETLRELDLPVLLGSGGLSLTTLDALSARLGVR